MFPSHAVFRFKPRQMLSLRKISNESISNYMLVWSQCGMYNRFVWNNNSSVESGNRRVGGAAKIKNGSTSHLWMQEVEGLTHHVQGIVPTWWKRNRICATQRSARSRQRHLPWSFVWMFKQRLSRVRTGSWNTDKCIHGRIYWTRSECQYVGDSVRKPTVFCVTNLILLSFEPVYTDMIFDQF